MAQWKQQLKLEGNPRRDNFDTHDERMNDEFPFFIC